jgi:hypothetical protein
MLCLFLVGNSLRRELDSRTFCQKVTDVKVTYAGVAYAGVAYCANGTRVACLRHGYLALLSQWNQSYQMTILNFGNMKMFHKYENILQYFLCYLYAYAWSSATWGGFLVNRGSWVPLHPTFWLENLPLQSTEFHKKLGAKILKKELNYLA